MEQLTRGERISRALKGRTVSEETRRKISQNSKGQTRSLETCRKMAAAKQGIPRSEAARAKISDGMTTAWAEGRAGKKKKP
jgi:hypothetical protein